MNTGSNHCAMDRRPGASAARRVALGTVLLVASATASAGCVSGHALESDATFPTSLAGRVVYHAYVSYGDGSSHLYLYDFASHARVRLDTPAWNIVDPMNAGFSPDGKRIVFMGRQGGNWNVFAWTIGSGTAPANLTATLGGRNEDPKYSFDGRQVVLKHEGDVYRADVAVDAKGVTQASSFTALTNDGWNVEESMPALTADGAAVFYATGTGTGMRIWRKDLATGQAAQFVTPPSGGADYFPVVRDADTYFFSRVMPGAGNDQIMQQPVDGSTAPRRLSINDCDGNDSDAAPAGARFLVFSSTAYGSGYALMLGKLANGKVWRIAPGVVDVDDGRAKLGASYTDAR